MSRSRKKVGALTSSERTFKKGQNKQARVNCRNRLAREDYESFSFNQISTHIFHGYYKRDSYLKLYCQPTLDDQIKWIKQNNIRRGIEMTEKELTRKANKYLKWELKYFRK